MDGSPLKLLKFTYLLLKIMVLEQLMFMFPKYMAANLITFKPVKNLYFSIGNSIIYSQNFRRCVYHSVLVLQITGSILFYFG